MHGQRFIIVTLALVMLGVTVGIGFTVWNWPTSPAGPMSSVREAMRIVNGKVEFLGLSWTYETRWGMSASYVAIWSVNGLIVGLLIASIDQMALLTWRLLRGGRQREQRETE